MAECVGGIKKIITLTFSPAEIVLDLEIVYIVFFFTDPCIKNPSDATLAPLSISRQSRRPPRCLPDYIYDYNMDFLCYIIIFREGSGISLKENVLSMTSFSDSFIVKYAF